MRDEGSHAGVLGQSLTGYPIERDDGIYPYAQRFVQSIAPA